MTIEGGYTQAIELVGVACSKIVVAKAPGETRVLSLDFVKDLLSAETVTSTSALSAAPTGAGHITIDNSALSGSECMVTLSAGFGGKAFTAESDDGTFTAASHGLSDGDTIHIIEDGAEDLPGGVDENTMYFVVSSGTDNFKVAAVSGGDPIDLTSDGQGVAHVDYVISCTAGTSNNQTLTLKGIVAVRD